MDHDDVRPSARPLECLCNTRREFGLMPILSCFDLTASSPSTALTRSRINGSSKDRYSNFLGSRLAQPLRITLTSFGRHLRAEQSRRSDQVPRGSSALLSHSRHHERQPLSDRTRLQRQGWLGFVVPLQFTYSPQQSALYLSPH
jgi:hypothetical protein